VLASCCKKKKSSRKNSRSSSRNHTKPHPKTKITISFSLLNQKHRAINQKKFLQHTSEESIRRIEQKHNKKEDKESTNEETLTGLPAGFSNLQRNKNKPKTKNNQNRGIRNTTNPPLRSKDPAAAGENSVILLLDV